MFYQRLPLQIPPRILKRFLHELFNRSHQIITLIGITPIILPGFLSDIPRVYHGSINKFYNSSGDCSTNFSHDCPRFFLEVPPDILEAILSCIVSKFPPEISLGISSKTQELDTSMNLKILSAILLGFFQDFFQKLPMRFDHEVLQEFFREFLKEHLQSPPDFFRKSKNFAKISLIEIHTDICWDFYPEITY